MRERIRPLCRAAAGRRSAFTLLEMLVVIAIILLLVAILLPAVQMSRDAARRAGCKNNLWQLGLALENYEHAHGVLPPGSVDPNRPIVDDGKGYHVSWIVQILPFIDQGNVYRRFDFSAGVYDPRNQAVAAVSIPGLSCPAGANGYTGCHHDVSASIDVDNHGVLFLNSSIRSTEIPDGAANTLYLGESGGITGQGFGWMSGTAATLSNTGVPINVGLMPSAVGGVDLANVRQNIPGGFGSNHSNGAQFLLGGGQVRFFNEGVGLKVLQQLAHRFDGAMVNDF